jgi:hypothetical protein
MDAMVESEVESDVDSELEAADIVDENDMETGRVLGGDEPSNRVDEYISNPLAFGESGCGKGCGGETGGIGKLATGAACTCRKYVVKYIGRRARIVDKIRLYPGMDEWSSCLTVAY